MSKRVLVLCVVIRLRMSCTFDSLLDNTGNGKSLEVTDNIIYAANTTLSGLVQKEKLGLCIFLKHVNFCLCITNILKKRSKKPQNTKPWILDVIAVLSQYLIAGQRAKGNTKELQNHFPTMGANGQPH